MFSLLVRIAVCLSFAAPMLLGRDANRNTRTYSIAVRYALTMPSLKEARRLFGVKQVNHLRDAALLSANRDA
jgi:hypothetical protein